MKRTLRSLKKISQLFCDKLKKVMEKNFLETEN